MDKPNLRGPIGKHSPTQRTKIIKRYGNRKLYDTEQSSYVVLNDIAKMIRNKEDIQVIDNETKNDITLSTLIQIIFGAEKKTNIEAPVDILKSIIREGDGSFSSFLAKIGLFNVREKTSSSEKKSPYYKTFSVAQDKKSKPESDQSIGEKVASLVKNRATTGEQENKNIPQLPGNGLNN